MRLHVAWFTLDFVSPRAASVCLHVVFFQKHQSFNRFVSCFGLESVSIHTYQFIHIKSNLVCLVEMSLRDFKFMSFSQDLNELLLGRVFLDIELLNDGFKGLPLLLRWLYYRSCY